MQSSATFVSSLATLVLALPIAADTTVRVSVDSADLEGNADCSGYPAISGDGRYVVFASLANNLVPGDTNNLQDIFVRDNLLGTTVRVSLSSLGAEADGSSVDPFISADGRYVQYTSHASNLVAGDTIGVTDGFVFDRLTSTTTRVTVGAGGVEGNGPSAYPVLSADGRYVAFASEAANLVVGDTNGRSDVFVRDLLLGTTTRVSVTPSGGQADSDSDFSILSGNGRHVVFTSTATNLVAGDTNGTQDVFRRDLLTGVTERVSVSSTGAQSLGVSFSLAWANVTPDGRFVAFDNDGDDLTPGDTNLSSDAYLRDMLLGTTTRVSVPALGGEGDNASFTAAPAANGRFVTFTSFATNMVPGDTNGVIDIFVRDVQLGTTRRISVDSAGGQGDGKSNTAMPTPDGRHVAFWSEASNLAPLDSNGVSDVFVVSRSWVLFQQFGTGLAGSAGFVPELGGKNGPATAGGYTIQVEDVLGGAVGLLLVGAGQADLFPILGGHLYVNVALPYVTMPLAVSGFAGFPGMGSAAFSDGDLSGSVGQTFFLQYFALDAGATQGVSMTNGLKLSVSG